jgi:RNA polymerase sigma factor (sigma-70 family)
VKNLDNSILIKYIDRIYGYAMNKTFSQDEADELSQEILFTAIKQFPTLKNEKSFEPWLWGIANNLTKVFRRTQGRQRDIYSYDMLEIGEHIDEYPFEDKQVYEQVRTQIAMLSSLYRDIIILYYYDNLSCKAIAEKLNIPEGTVTWRLSEGRRKLKKECVNMTETALRPVIMDIRISGSGNYNGKDIPFPWVFINDALSQNILYHCYHEPKTVEELAKLCGVPAFYIEDAIENLLQREAIIQILKGKYQTNFIIYDKEDEDYNEKTKSYAKEMTKDFISVLKCFTKDILDRGIYAANKDENEFYYLFGVMALEHLNKVNNPIETVPFEVRYDGNRWTYHARLKEAKKAKPSHRISIEKSRNRGSDGKLEHYAYHFGGFAYRRTMTDYKINICEKILLGEECSKKEEIANMVKDGYLKRLESGKIIVDIPFFTLEQKQKFDELAEQQFSDIVPTIVKATKNYAEGYHKLFPKHLKDDVQRACNSMFVGIFGNIVSLAVEDNLMDKPNENSICDVLIEHK